MFLNWVADRCEWEHHIVNALRRTSVLVNEVREHTARAGIGTENAAQRLTELRQQWKMLSTGYMQARAIVATACREKNDIQILMSPRYILEWSGLAAMLDKLQVDLGVIAFTTIRPHAVRFRPQAGECDVILPDQLGIRTVARVRYFGGQHEGSLHCSVGVVATPASLRLYLARDVHLEMPTLAGGTRGGIQRRLTQVLREALEAARGLPLPALGAGMIPLAWRSFATHSGLLAASAQPIEGIRDPLRDEPTASSGDIVMRLSPKVLLDAMETLAHSELAKIGVRIQKVVPEVAQDLVAPTMMALKLSFEAFYPANEFGDREDYGVQQLYAPLKVRDTPKSREVFLDLYGTGLVLRAAGARMPKPTVATLEGQPAIATQTSTDVVTLSVTY